MQYATLDSIVRRSLLEKSLPLHYYLEYILHQSAAIRELSMDTLKIINTVNLKLNSYGAVDLPGDFVDDVSVGIPVGGLVQPLVKRDTISRLRVHNETTGVFEQYEDAANLNQSMLTFYGLNLNYFFYWRVNDYGEPTGGYYGANGGAHQNGYKVIKERNQIQFTGAITTDNVILTYISNGQSVDNATMVDWAAHSAIQAYSDWKSSQNAAFKDSPEARTFYNEKRLLRARLNPLTTTDIVDTLRTAYSAAIKN